ncbi:hypothetical protein ACHAWF_016215 [Thalassiosira exigua]
MAQLLASDLDLDVDAADIVDFELNLFSIQKARWEGRGASSYTRRSWTTWPAATCRAHERRGRAARLGLSMVAMFDHEEVGSSSATGAESPIIAEAVRRIGHALGAGSPTLSTAPSSIAFVLSVDQAHAVHPNYAPKHESGHGPKMNGDMVIKRNSNQRYATKGGTGLVVLELARRAGLPLVQEFVVWNDCACGSTIGRSSAQPRGSGRIDMGCPQLSMHSIWETMGARDFAHGLALFQAFFDDFSSVDSSIEN